MLHARNLTHRIGAKALIENVTLDFEPGRLHLLIGPNGAGKSTLVKALARLLRPQEGTVRYGDVAVESFSDGALARCRAVLSQAVEVAFPIPVRDLVMMGRYPHFRGSHPGAVDEEICDEVMRFFDVIGLADRIYSTLSGGERQRVNFARVLAQVWRPSPEDARYLFLDEPLTFLDVRHQIQFMKQVRAFGARPDVVTVGVVHDLNLAARFADRLVLLDAGRVAADGTPEEVLTGDRLPAVFQITPVIVRDPSVGGIHLVFH
ncbi:MAG: heme ABC transporter ATP-binding protein [Acidobacteria bacterium]|nr:heme ABC transporter ATP-binding protein [Acidobacteriota bacterium]